jgi:hypothetical protein
MNFVFLALLLVSPEIKQTVDAVLGSWNGQMTAVVPGGGSETFPWKMDCQRAALGAGAVCTSDGTASIGAMAQTCLLAYSREEKSVHYMCVTSMGEVHDHKGQWKADSIEFAPLEGFLSGGRMVENVTMSFPNRSMMKTRSVVTLPDSSVMTFDFTGTRKQ